MKKVYFRLALIQLGCLIAFAGMAQTNVTKTLTFNKIRFNVNTIYASFYDRTNGKAAFHDTELGAAYIYSSIPWIGATAPLGDLKLASGLFSYVDWTTGPISNNSNAVNSYNKVYTMSSELINEYKTKFGQSGYTIPQEILDWPGSGVSSDNESPHLAPYFDKNANGKYEPNLGDYPVIKGDMAALVIRNDNTTHANSGGAPLKANIIIMYYAYYSTTAPLDRAVFIDYTIENLSAEDYSNTYFGTHTDFALGNPHDDYIGTLVKHDAVYCYNGDNDDDATNGGFGLNPPSIAQVYLNHPLETSLYYNIGGGPTGDPNNANDHYNYLKGLWRDNTPMLYGGNGHYDEGGELSFPIGCKIDEPCKFMYPGDSDPLGLGTDGNNYGYSETWNEFNSQNAPGDRRIVASVILGDLKMNVPVTVSSVYIASITDLETAIQDTKNQIAGLREVTKSTPSFQLAPNPAGNYVKVSGMKDLDATAEIIDLTGRILISAPAATPISTEALGNGTYLIRLSSKNGALTEFQRLIICR